MIENILLHIFDLIIGGNSNCHEYTHSLGETGGWQDEWCPHNVKYGSKMMVLQESVLDPADIYLSLIFPPVLQVCDDPCGLMAHMECSQPKISSELFGINRGCFEPPDKINTPKKDHDCPELMPLSLVPRKPCETALDNPTQKVHPISKSTVRKVLGTRLSESHKTLNECAFHNVNLCKQAAFIKDQDHQI